MYNYEAFVIIASSVTIIKRQKIKNVTSKASLYLIVRREQRQERDAGGGHKKVHRAKTFKCCCNEYCISTFLNREKYLIFFP